MTYAKGFGANKTTRDYLDEFDEKTKNMKIIISDARIEEALIELDKFLQIVNPVELGIFKIKIGPVVDQAYKNKMIMIVSDIINKNHVKEQDSREIDPYSPHAKWVKP